VVNIFITLLLIRTVQDFFHLQFVLMWRRL